MDELAPETVRLRSLPTADLADEVGVVKAQIADLEAKEEELKREAIRRGIIGKAEGHLFEIDITPPSTQMRLDRKRLEAAFGEGFIGVFSVVIEIGWKMTCRARNARRRTQKHKECSVV